MKILFGLAIIASVSCSILFDQTLDNDWEAFKVAYNKLYTSKYVENYRRTIWERNSKQVNKHNKEGKHTYTQKINKFGDLTNEEFRKFIGGFNVSMKTKTKGNIFVATNFKDDIPDSVDWRIQGYVTPIKDQGSNCGSSWAFSANTALEGQNFKASGKLVSLSEQNLIDCSTKQGNEGCTGGYMDQSFTYVKENKGIDTEVSYPYEGQDGKCRFKASNVGTTCTGYVDIKSGSESDLTLALANIGPIATAVDAGQSGFQFYSKGVYYDSNCDTKNPNHGIGIVGYGSLAAGQDYYILKNMWGESWGDKGYILTARNRDNNCGVAAYASYPTV